MSIVPLITFKAGECEFDAESGASKIKCKRTPGYIYLYRDDAESDFTHFCWRPRSKPVDEPELDLIMVHTDGTFTPYTGKDYDDSSEYVTSPTNGRIYALKFSSSSSRHFFWLQSKSQHPDGKDNAFSPRDLTIGRIVNALLSGEDVDVQSELVNAGGPGRPDDGDEDMADVPPDNDLRRTSTGGAGADATGGDIREEGEEAREGGADGGRAASSGLPTNASDAVQSFLRSLQGGNMRQSSRQQQTNVYTTLSDLLTPEACISSLSSASPAHIDRLLSLLPPQLLLLAQEADDLAEVDVTSETAQAAIEALSMEQKKDLLTRVFRSPQLHQSLGSLTMAIRDGGLPMVAESLEIPVENGGLIKGGNMPLGEGNAVEAFVKGVKKSVEKEKEGGERMDES